MIDFTDDLTQLEVLALAVNTAKARYVEAADKRQERGDLWNQYATLMHLYRLETRRTRDD